MCTSYTRIAYCVCLLLFGFLASTTTKGQSSTGSISGVVTDENNAVIAGAVVTIRNIATGLKRSTSTNSEGHYRFVVIPIGNYEITTKAPNFGKYVQSGITVSIGQEAEVNTTLPPVNIRATVTVDANASMLNSTTPEISTRFDSRRLSELPIAPNRNLYNALLLAQGVNQLANGQTSFALGISFSASGGRLRSNYFLLDGQDINDPSLTGSQMPLNNPDAIQEVNIITNQFLPEYGHNSGSVANFVGKAGTNAFHGTLFCFHNNENLNACSNTDKQAGFCDPNASDASKKNAPLRRENQVGFTFGGPVVLPSLGDGGPYLFNGRDRTFFFVDYQRWTDRRLPSLTLKGAPTANGREALLRYGGDLPQVQDLLRIVPAAAPDPNLRTLTVTMASGSVFDVQRGDLVATSNLKFRSDQGSVRIDHQFDQNNLVFARYRTSYESTRGTGQIAPPGLGTSDDRNAHAAAVVWTSAISPSISNEARLAWKRYDVVRQGAENSLSGIPAIQINELGMTGDRESERRTAIGLAVNLPVIRTNDTYQITDSLTLSRSKHLFKFGADLLRNDEKDLLSLASRGSLVYTTLNNFVNDIPERASKSLPMPGGDLTQFYRWYEFYVYAQDQWKIRPDLTLTYGVRYEYPGDSFGYLRDLNRRIVAANSNDPAYKFEPDPRTDMNNWMPRIGFSWSPHTSTKGILGFVTGGDKLVIRGGYARAHDTEFINTNQNIFQSFPFTAALNFASLPNPYSTLINTTVPNIADPRRVSRTVTSPDFRAPATDQFSLDFQRELTADLVLKIGYARTRGTGLFQTVDGNPRVPCLLGAGTCNTTQIDRNTVGSIPRPPEFLRVDPTRGAISVRANSASSTYDALQTSLEKRLSRGIAFGVHYTWSALIDTASDVLNLSVAEVASAQDPFNWNAEKARSGYDRPHRLAGNIVYELPFYSKQRGVVGKLLGGWQVNSIFNFQSGAPFTVLNGSDPAGVDSPGIRPDVFTSLDVSRMSVTQLYLIERGLRAAAWAEAQRAFDNLPTNRGRCITRWLPGLSLPLTLFSAPRARIVCDGLQRHLDIQFEGILEGQRVGSAGRNILRADSLRLVDIGLIKNTNLTENIRAQFWVNFFNAFNWRNFGIPLGTMTDPGFLDQWATDGGNRRIQIGARLVF